jgi:hypothetical protein
MSSNSEVSYGARIGNAEKLATAVTNFNNYQPLKPEFNIGVLNDLISQIKNDNTLVAGSKQNYSLAVANRKVIFDIGKSSIEKLLSPINNAVKGIYGKTAKESIEVANIIAKIRGANATKSKSSKPEEQSVSQSYQSYSSKAQFWSDLTVNITAFGANYDPPFASIKMEELNKKYTDAVEANNLVMDTFTKFAQINTTRNNNYDKLSELAQRIKDSIKSQYGFNSTEYKLIKSLKI